jgi:hypothetical protein
MSALSAPLRPVARQNTLTPPPAAFCDDELAGALAGDAVRVEGGLP